MWGAVSGPGGEHKRLEDVEEHERTWEVCLDCGGQWTDDGEQVTEGDGYCLDEALAEEETAARWRAPRCRECGDPTDDGEGWDGLCGNCADREEAGG
jgi:hypothetical protein